MGLKKRQISNVWLCHIEVNVRLLIYHYGINEINKTKFKTQEVENNMTGNQY